MNTKEAGVIIDKIHELARSIEIDEELKSIDERYSISASWCDLDISMVSLE